MNILAIDTTSSWGSVSLSRDSKIVYLGYLDIRVTHSERLMQQIDHGLKQSSMSLDDMDLIALSNGPGSFTGIRIGLATAKGICMAKQLPLYSVNTLKLLAYNVVGCQVDILPFIDARMNEVYAALYDKDMEEIVTPMSSDPADFLKKVQKQALILGDGVDKYRETIENSSADLLFGLPHQNFPLASTLISLVISEGIKLSYSFQDIAALEPCYLRRSQAEIRRK